MVTGASGGLGRYFAQVLADAGAKVVVAERRESKVLGVVDQIKTNGGVALAVKLDVKSEESIKAAFNQAEEEFSTVNIVINNAGISGRQDTLDISSDGWNDVMDTNWKRV